VPGERPRVKRGIEEVLIGIESPADQLRQDLADPIPPAGLVPITYQSIITDRWKEMNP
jgi:hypothetical protein